MEARADERVLLAEDLAHDDQRSSQQLLALCVLVHSSQERSEIQEHARVTGVPRGQRFLLDLKGDPTAPLRTAAHRVTNLLPPRLRLDARWMTCGALTGALGCVAAATLLSPVAIAGLPMWTAIGAAIATVTKAFMPADTATNEQTPTNSNKRSDALRTAALFALLLEVQGRDEVAITRILDRTLPEDGDLTVDSVDTARVWLDDLRHRFDIALTKETSA